MANLSAVFVGMMEEQVALLSKHIAILKGNEVPEVAIPVVVETKASKRKAKPPVDPLKPKKPPSAYLLYMSENQGPFKE